MAKPRFEIRPLGPWIGRVTEARRSGAAFRAVWDDTVKLLLDEVSRLDGGMLVLQVDADASHIRRDGMLHARARVGFPGVKVSFDSRHGPLTYVTDAYESWQANVRAIALGLGALRAVDRYGIGSTGEQYRGWTAIANSSSAGMSRAEAAQFLVHDLDGRYTAERVLASASEAQQAYRQAALRWHPDRPDGNAELMVRLTAARDVLIGDGRG